MHTPPPERVQVITQDGRTIVGELKGFDQTTNVILSNSIERVFTTEPEEETELVPLGVYIIRGDNIALIGEIDLDRDGQIDWTTVKADPIAEVVH